MSDDILLEELYRDADLCIVNKPCGLPSQADRSGDPSVVDAPQLKGALGVPHRLDRPVSGALVVALSAAGLSGMSALFRDRRVKKTYWAMVQGQVDEAFVLRHTLEHSGRQRRAVVKGEGQGNAVVHVRRLVQADRYALVEVVPEGGAFHQIRAQLGAAGLPIKGDVKYGARRGERDRSIALHARSIAFKHPVSGTRISVEAPAPVTGIWPQLQAILDPPDVP